MYAGFPFIASLDGVKLPAGSEFRIERRAASGFKTVGTGTATTDATAILPRGKQTLRARAGTIFSELRTVTVRPASAKRTRVRGGKWKGGGAAAVPSIRLAPDGSFVGASTRSGAVRVRGRLKGSKLAGGFVEMSLGTCTGSSKLSAARA